MNEQLERIPERHEIPEEDKWDLSGMFVNDEAWDNALIG